MPSLVMKLNQEREFETEINGNTIRIDIPENMGGKGSGASPSDYFLASLASCIGVYVVNYLGVAGMDCSEAEITLEYEIADAPRRFTNFRARVNLPNCTCGPRREAILRTAKSCVIHNTLEHFGELAVDITCGDNLDCGEKD